MILPLPVLGSPWSGPEAHTVQVRQRSGLHHDPEPHGNTWLVANPESQQAPSFIVEPGELGALAEQLTERDERCVHDVDGAPGLYLVRLAFTLQRGQLGLVADLMPHPLARSFRLDVWCIPPGVVNDEAENLFLDHVLVPDVSPLLMRGFPDGDGTRWEFLGAVRTPLRPVEPLPLDGEMPLYCGVRTSVPPPLASQR